MNNLREIEKPEDPKLTGWSEKVIQSVIGFEEWILENNKKYHAKN